MLARHEMSQGPGRRRWPLPARGCGQDGRCGSCRGPIRGRDRRGRPRSPLSRQLGDGYTARVRAAALSDPPAGIQQAWPSIAQDVWHISNCDAQWESAAKQFQTRTCSTSPATMSSVPNSLTQSRRTGSDFSRLSGTPIANSRSTGRAGTRPVAGHHRRGAPVGLNGWGWPNSLPEAGRPEEVCRSMKCLVVIECGPTSFGACVPDLPGCVAVAATREEVTTVIHEAIGFHVEAMKEGGLPPPAPGSSPQPVGIDA
jgi:predicted RNase H-like HicB family nuclease